MSQRGQDLLVESMYLESESLASIAISVRHMVSLWVFAFQLGKLEIHVAS